MQKASGTIMPRGICAASAKNVPHAGGMQDSWMIFSMRTAVDVGDCSK